MPDNTTSNMRVDATAFECCVCMEGEKQEHDQSVMSNQKEVEQRYHFKTQGDFGFLSKVCENGHMVCLACHEYMWDKNNHTLGSHTCPMCRAKLIEPNSLGNHDLISVYPTAELLAGGRDTNDPQTIETNCVSWASVVASKVMNLPDCLTYYIDEALVPDQRMAGWTNETRCLWRLRWACYKWISNVHKLLQTRFTIAQKKVTAEQYKNHLRLTDPTNVFIFYDSIEQYCEKEIIAPLIDMNRQIRRTIDAYANKKTMHTDKLWVFQIKEAFGYYSGNVQNRFGISDRKNPLKMRYVSYYSPKHDRNIDLAESDIDLPISRLRNAIVPLPNLRNTKDVLWCIGMMQTSILEEDDELRNFNGGTQCLCCIFFCARMAVTAIQLQNRCSNV